jgi:hypothetical protein
LPAWKGGGTDAKASLGRTRSQNAHSLMRTKSGRTTGSTAEAMEVGELESIAQYYESLDVQSKLRWGTLHGGRGRSGKSAKDSARKGVRRALPLSARIHASEPMKRRLENALENFEVVTQLISETLFIISLSPK